MHNAASDQGLNCLPIIQQFFDTPTGNEMVQLVQNLKAPYLSKLDFFYPRKV